MKVAIDVSPLSKGHRYRGIGKYTEELVKSLRELRIENLELRMILRGKIPNDADLIHYPYFDPFWLTLPLVKPKPVVVTIHDVTPLVFPADFPPGIKGRIKLAIQKISLKGVGAVITDSKSAKKDIVKFLGYPQKKIKVIVLAASADFRPLTDKKFLSLIKKKYQLPDQFALYVGDVNPNKNIPRLVGGCKLAKIPLIIVGKQAGEITIDRCHPENRDLVWLQDYCQRPATNDQRPTTRLLGFLPTRDLVGVYNLASVYVQPSLYEGFGLPVLEAMACGCPVVVSRVASLPEVVGTAALFIDPYDISDISQGIREVVKNKRKADQLRQWGLAQAKRFSWEKTAKATYGVYRQLVSER